MAPLQRRATYGLIVGIIWAIALVAVFVSKGGIDTFVVDRGFEALMVGIIIGGIVAYIFILLATRGEHGKVSMDERDKTILAGARATQLWSAMLILAVWMISLSEIYWEQGQVPVQYLYIIAMSTWLVVMITENVGILVGYWRS